MSSPSPKNFLWGAATSSHQVEGGNRNDWSEWELRNAALQMLNAQKKEWQDHILSRHPNPLQKENYISGIACDHYRRFREDFDIAKQLGHNAHRFSLEWSRIEPEEGRFNEKEIEHYREVIRALRERGLEPFVTLWHWTLPLWLRDKGGVESKEFPDHFVRYVRYVVERLGSEATFWMTLNEPTSVIVNSYVRGIWPPQKKSLIVTLRVFHVLAKAHRLAYTAIHELKSDAQVGFGNILSFFEPARNWNPLDHVTLWVLKFWSNQYFFWLTGKSMHDYLAIQNYFHHRITFLGRQTNENKKVSDMGWELYPESLYYVLKEWGSLKKPIYITEHGLADAEDNNRAWYIKEAVKNIHRAHAEGVDVRGYFHWSLLDNFEWDKGFWPRFGLVEIDYENALERKIRSSAWEYKKIIKAMK